MQYIKNFALVFGNLLPLKVLVFIGKINYPELKRSKIADIIRQVVQSKMQIRNNFKCIAHFNNFKIDEYKYVCKLGQGSFGKVCKLKFKNEYIIKKVSKCGVECDTIREIGCYALLMHSIGKDLLMSPCMLGFNLSDKKIILGLECASCDLNSYGKSLTVDQRYQVFDYIFTQCLLSLSQIHACGIIHCDIKPENLLIWLSEDKKISRIGLADFGLSSSRPDHSRYVYTCPYRPPEHLTGYLVPNKQSDVWAMGATLVTFLEDDLIFYDENEEHYRLLYLRQEYSNLNFIERKFSKRKILKSMLNMDPEKRLVCYEPFFVYPKRNWSINQDLDLKTELCWLWYNTSIFGKACFIHAIDIIHRYLNKEMIIQKNLRGICVMAASIATKWGIFPYRYDDCFINLDYAHWLCPQYDKFMLSLFEQRIINELNGLIYIPGLEYLANSLPDDVEKWILEQN